jgi:predicted transcriptional regulator
MAEKLAVAVQSGEAFDTVAKFMEQIIDLTPEEIEKKAKAVEPELYTLFRQLERLHAVSDKFQQVDLSEDVYTLLRMLERRKVIKYFPFLSRAAGLL